MIKLRETSKKKFYLASSSSYGGFSKGFDPFFSTGLDIADNTPKPSSRAFQQTFMIERRQAPSRNEGGFMSVSKVSSPVAKLRDPIKQPYFLSSYSSPKLPGEIDPKTPDAITILKPPSSSALMTRTPKVSSSVSKRENLFHIRTASESFLRFTPSLRQEQSSYIDPMTSNFRGVQNYGFEDGIRNKPTLDFIQESQELIHFGQKPESKEGQKMQEVFEQTPKKDRYELLISFDRQNSRSLEKTAEIIRTHDARLIKRSSSYQQKKIFERVKAKLEGREYVKDEAQKPIDSSEDDDNPVRRQSVKLRGGKKLLVFEKQAPYLENLFKIPSSSPLAAAKALPFLKKTEPALPGSFQQEVQIIESLKLEYKKYLEYLKNPTKAGKKLDKLLEKYPTLKEVFITKSGRAKEDITEHCQVYRPKRNLSLGPNTKPSGNLSGISGGSIDLFQYSKKLTIDECKTLRDVFFEVNFKYKLKTINRTSHSIIASGQKLVEQARGLNQPILLSEFLPKVDPYDKTILMMDELRVEPKTKMMAHQLQKSLESVHDTLSKERIYVYKTNKLR